MIPAIFATSKTLPFATWFVSISRTVPGAIRTRPLATASRTVSGRSVTSTMWMLPLSSRWVSCLLDSEVMRDYALSCLLFCSSLFVFVPPQGDHKELYLSPRQDPPTMLRSQLASQIFHRLSYVDCSTFPHDQGTCFS